MTSALRQEAYELIDAMSEEKLRELVALIVTWENPLPKAEEVGSDGLTAKRRAFLKLEELKKRHPIPKDYDWEEARREAMEEKYGCFM